MKGRHGRRRASLLLCPNRSPVMLGSERSSTRTLCWWAVTVAQLPPSIRSGVSSEKILLSSRSYPFVHSLLFAPGAMATARTRHEAPASSSAAQAQSGAACRFRGAALGHWPCQAWRVAALSWSCGRCLPAASRSRCRRAVASS